MENILIFLFTSDLKIWSNHLLPLITKHQCTVEESRSLLLGTEWGGMMRVSGNWNTIAKLEDALVTLKEEQPQLSFEFKRRRSAPLKLAGDYLPYLVQAVGVNKPNFLNELIHLFVEQGIQLIELQTDIVKSNYAETKLLHLLMRIHVPATISITDLRERFMLLCEDMNADGILEPEKRNL
jgi:glycine cleavage system transcriptional repressor